MSADTGSAAVLPQPEPALVGITHSTPPVPFDKQYTYVKALGSGGEANCDRFERTDTGKAFAVKTIVHPNPTVDYLHEANILAKLPEHNRLIEVIEVHQSGPHLRIVMPLYSGGDFAVMYRKLSMFGLTAPEAFIWHVFIQAAEGLHHIHTNPVMSVVHRDLKPENFLIDLTPFGILFDDIKIIDFGLATTNTEPHEHYGGTVKYQPPECPTASKAADVYALTGSIYYLMTGRAPRPECPPSVQGDDIHRWYLKNDPAIIRLLSSDHTDYCADLQPLSHSDAYTATINHPTPIPMKMYSPLLEHWILRGLDPNVNTRATTDELITGMAADARLQIDLYKKWIPKSGKRPTCGFVYPPPPSGWKPE